MYKPAQVINTLESVVLYFRSVALKYTYPKYFHNDPSDYQALPFSDVLRGTVGVLDQQTNDKWLLNCSYHGDNRSTQILLITKFDPGKPSLIYHHGAGSTTPLRDFNIIFGKPFLDKFNVFVVWAQYHTSKEEYLNQSVDSFLHHQETFAGSVLAYEEIVKFHRGKSEKPIVATGSSMGGIVSSLHAFYFGSADYYFPLVAYPNVGEIFLGQEYKTAVQDWDKKRENNTYLSSFKIDSFDKSLTQKLFPVLGSYDRVVPYEKASKFWQEKGFKVKIFPYGHFTPGVATKDVREYVLTTIGL